MRPFCILDFANTGSQRESLAKDEPASFTRIVNSGQPGRLFNDPVDLQP